MRKFSVDVKAFMTVIVEAPDEQTARSVVDEFVEACDPTEAFIWGYNSRREGRPIEPHKIISANGFSVDGSSDVEPYEDERQCECLNCMWNGGEAELNEIKDFHSRVEAGDTVVPAGECPECGCLAYLKDDEEPLNEDPAHVPGLNDALAPKGDA